MRFSEKHTDDAGDKRAEKTMVNIMS